MPILRRVRLLLAVVMLAMVANGAHAQPYPAKPVRMVVGYAPGGSVDIVARLVAQKLTESLGQQFVVENRAGASGNIGTDYVAKSAPDGYTLLMGSSPALAANTHLFAKMPFDPAKDLAPIILVANQPNVLVVHPSSPATNVKELIALAQSRAAGLTFGTSGLGASQHIAAELFMMMTGVKMVHVPYKGGAPALGDLLGGHIDLMFEVLPTTIQHIREGRLRALAVTTRQRSGMLPAVPTLAEAGLAGYEFRGWIGLAAPAALPEALIAKLNAEVRKAMGAGDLKTKLLEYGLDIAGGTPEDFGAFMREDSANYGRIVKAARIQPQ